MSDQLLATKAEEANSVALVLAKVEELLRLARRHKIYIAGFAFNEVGGPPCMMNFGNCNDMGKLELFKLLVETCDKRRKEGLMDRTVIRGDVN